MAISHAGEIRLLPVLDQCRIRIRAGSSADQLTSESVLRKLGVSGLPMA